MSFSGVRISFSSDLPLPLCSGRNEDEKMFETLGLRSRPAFLPYASGNESR